LIEINLLRVQVARVVSGAAGATSALRSLVIPAFQTCRNTKDAKWIRVDVDQTDRQTRFLIRRIAGAQG